MKLDWNYVCPAVVKRNIKEIMVGVFNDMLKNVDNSNEMINKMQGAMELYNAIAEELDSEKEDK